MRLRHLSLFMPLALMATTTAWATGEQALKPKPTDKCPVCGMFVAKYPDFAAHIRFRDGATVHFDGPKDLLRYYHDLKRYNPKKQKSDIAAVYVTSYYSLTPTDGLTARYVSGSDVYGPMGQELIPFEREREAKEFLRDHKGKTILRWRDITPAVLKTLE